MTGRTANEPSRQLRGVAVFLLLATFALALAACVSVEVVNLSETSARVRITLPDTPNGYTRLVRAGGSTSTFSEYGGTVTITVLPDEEYRDLLVSLREQIGRRLFDERQTLSASDVSTLTDRLNEIDRLVEQSARQGAKCSVRTSDYATVTAILQWNDSISNWDLDCSVRNEES